MARKARLEFAGAIYHVLNRGYLGRRGRLVSAQRSEAGLVPPQRSGAGDLFGTAEAAQAFVDCLFEAAERMKWRIHAYCLMPNAYQLALETPRGNLVNGVHWLQSAFGNRFHRFQREPGRAFQGRYRAILIEPGSPLAQVVDYIHLSPVLEGLVTLEQLAQFRWSSYRSFIRGKVGRPATLVADDWLKATGGLSDSKEGWLGYAEHVGRLMAAEGRRKGAEFSGMGKGWVRGGEDFRRVRLQQFRQNAAARDWGGAELAEINRLEWENRLESGARTLGRNLTGAAKEAKAAGWKVALASWMKGSTSVSNRWLGERLHMGPPDAVSRYAGELRQGKRPQAAADFARLGATGPAGP